MTAQTTLFTWLQRRLAPPALAWQQTQAAQFSARTADGKAGAGAADRTVFSSFSAALRHSGKDPLALDAEELKSAGAAVEGWNPLDWTLDEAARIYLLLALPAGAESARMMNQMYETADVGEALALQKSLPLLPTPEGHLARAREAIRSNIKQVFEAVTLRNPYPARHFDDTGWNQMVVKTFFMESPLGEVWGLDRRVNAPLRQMLVDLAHERWAAGRTFSAMLWRCVGPLADAKALAALKKTLAHGARAEKNAAALALASCRVPETQAEAAHILSAEPALAAAVKDGKITWENYHVV